MSDSTIPPKIMAELLELARENYDQFKHLNELEGLILRAHLIAEKNLNRIIERVIFKEFYRPEKFTFSQKLEIAKMVGAMTPEFEGPIRLLNKLRNQIAHTFSFDILVLRNFNNQIESNFRGLKKRRESEIEDFKESFIYLTSYLSLADRIARLELQHKLMKERMDDKEHAESLS